MKKFIFSLLVLFSFTVLQAQITDDDYKSLLPTIKVEDWKAVYKASSKLLKNTGDDNSDNAGLVRFLNIYAASGMVKDGNMKFEKLQVITDQFKGKKMLTPDFVACMNPQNTLNKTFFSNFDGLNKGFTIVTNKTGKIILYIDFDITNKIEPRSLHGKKVSCGGIIKEIELNPDKKTEWILKLKVSDAYIK